MRLRSHLADRTWGFLAAAIVAAAPARAELPLVGVNPGAPLWNNSILLTDGLAADIAASGCRAVRVNFRLDVNASWTPEHLARYDQIIANCRAHHLQVLGLICYEAVPGSQAQWNQNYNTTGLNPYITDFANTAFLLIDRYKDDVKLFEIWNEPSCWSVPPSSNPLNAGCFYIWPKIFANILAETYKACLAQGGPGFFADHGVSLCTGGLFAHDIGGSFSTAMADYMIPVYQQTAIWDAFEAVAGRRYPWDYFGYHFYLNGGEAVSTTELASYFNNVRTWKSFYGDGTPILVTEFGWNTGGVSPALQAANLRDSYNWMGTQSDVRTAYWYQWNDGDGGWGLVYGPGNPKPSYYEFQAQASAAAAPTAAFSAAPRAGRAPLSVQFANESIGLIDTYAWTFGDGGVSSAASPAHEYLAAGVYDVTLTVTGPGGADSETHTAFVTVSNPADFDGDGDADLRDYAAFAVCANGAGGTSVAPGCACPRGAIPAAASSYELAAGVGGLSAAISGTDLLSGAMGAKEQGGFHAATPGGEAGGLADLTDGAVGAAAEAVLADYARPSLQVRFDLATPRDIERIRVFAANGDGRVFQNYDVAIRVSGDPSFRPLASGVKTGAFGAVNSGSWGASLTTVQGAEPGPIAVGATGLRFTFHAVSAVDPVNVFWDPWDAGEAQDADGNPHAYVATIVKEIDVFEYAGPPLTATCADLDGDGDGDADDLGAFVMQFGGPG